MYSHTAPNGECSLYYLTLIYIPYRLLMGQLVIEYSRTCSTASDGVILLIFELDSKSKLKQVYRYIGEAYFFAYLAFTHKLTNHRDRMKPPSL